MHFRLFFFPLKISLEWFPLISTSIFLICLWIFNTSKQLWCFCRRTKGLGFWALVGILDLLPSTNRRSRSFSKWDWDPTEKEETQVIWSYFPMRNYRVARHWATFDLRRHFFFSFLQPRIGTTARWSTHWSALDTSTTCPWIASPQNSVAEGIAWTGLRWKNTKPDGARPQGFLGLCTMDFQLITTSPQGAENLMSR